MTESTYIYSILFFFKFTNSNSFKEFDPNALRSESHTSYEQCPLSKNIIYEFLLNFNWSMEKFNIL